MVHFTSSEEVLLAANKLVSKGKKEFTEWELTVAAWKLNKQRWGLRGFEQDYPDHKRVMNEIMAKGTQKVLGKGWLKRIRPNYYALTPVGKAKAGSLSKFRITKTKRNLDEYDAIAPYIKHRVFEKFCKDSNEPKTWLDVAAFLNLTKNESYILEQNLSSINEAIKLAEGWMDKNNENIIRRDDSSTPISRDHLARLKEFLSIIEERFKRQFDAIRAKKK